jgi:hypothetical protein
MLVLVLVLVLVHKDKADSCQNPRANCFLSNGQQLHETFCWSARTARQP